jgi:hypothetical protein
MRIYIGAMLLQTRWGRVRSNQEDGKDEGRSRGGGGCSRRQEEVYVKVLPRRPQINQFDWSGEFCQGEGE